MKKMISLILSMITMSSMAVGAASAAPEPAKSELAAPVAEQVRFDEDNIALTFGAISDIHITGDDSASSVALYRKALRSLKKFAGSNLDAVTISGDICELEYSRDITDEFKKINSEETPDTSYFFVAGNHDANQWHPEWLSAFFGDLSCYTDNDLPSAEPLNGNRHAVIGGYHFIGVNVMHYNVADGKTFTSENLEWLDRELAAARATAPGRHIFVYMHPQVYGTTWCSDDIYSSRDVIPVLSKYPEAVVFTGHYHTPNITDTTIHQKDFTTVNSGNVAFMCIEGGYLDMDGLKVPESYSVSNGMLAQVDGNGTLRLTRIDFNTGRMIKDYLYVDAPDTVNKTHLKRYDPDEIARTNSAPIFPAGASATVTRNAGNLDITYTAATDDDMVQYYRFDVRSLPSGITSTAKAYSDFWLYDKVSDFPSKYTKRVPVSLGGDSDFEVKITAIDSYGRESEPLVYNTLFGDAEYAPTEGLSMLNIDFISGSPRNCSPMKGVTVSSVGEVVRDSGVSAFECGSGKYAAFSTPATVMTLTAKKFTYEAAFRVGKLGTAQTVFGNNKGEKGACFGIDADGCITFTAHNSSGAVTLKSSEKLAEGEYHDAAATLSSGRLTLYLDGKPVGEAAFGGSLTYNSNAGYIVGAKADGSGYTEFFSGLVYQAGVGNTPYTAEQAAARHRLLAQERSYKILVPLYSEREYARRLRAANSEAADESVFKAIDNYIAELTAAISALPVSREYMDSVLRRDEVARTIGILGGVSEVEAVTEAPVLGGVEDGGIYDVKNGGAVPSWSNSTYAELDFGEAKSGAAITAVGKHRLIVMNGEKAVIAEFTVIDTTPHIKKGDADGDGEITVTDALKALRIAAKLVEPTENDIKILDIDNDGAITVTDALAILRVAAKLTDTL